MPPTTSQRVRCSPSSTSANITPSAGCRLENSDAREGPTLLIAVTIVLTVIAMRLQRPTETAEAGA